MPEHEWRKRASCRRGGARRTLPRFAGYFISWIAYLVITLWLVFELREMVVVVSMMLSLNPWQVHAIDNFVVFFLGLGWLSGTIAIEGYFRNGIARGQLWRRIGKTFLTVLIVVAADLGVKLALP